MMGTDNFGFLEDLLEKDVKKKLAQSGVLSQMSVKERLRPRMIICETTNICNASCVFCPYSIQSRARGVMSRELFIKILADYETMGGGYFSITPMVGDILLDTRLDERLEALAEYEKRILPSVTTNLYALDRRSDDFIRTMLERFHRLHISSYGITREECQAITKKDQFDKFVVNLERLSKIWQEGPRSCEITIGFRVAYDHPREKLEGFLKKICGHVFPFNSTHDYANWGNTMSGDLPGDARFIEGQTNDTPCVLLLVAMQVYWDGRVSACACCDYDASDQLALGDVNQESLLEIFNGEKSRKIWSDHGSGRLPGICEKCTFHVPISDLHSGHAIAGNITEFIGG